LTPRQNILFRVYVVFAVFLLAAVFAVGQVINIQFFEYNYWIEKKEKNVRLSNIEGKRGNIISADDKLVRTSTPYFDVAFDPMVVRKDILDKELDSLASNLFSFFKKKSKTAYKQQILLARKSNNQFISLGKNLGFSDVEEMRKWPVFRHGKNKGGFITKQEESRVNVFDKMLSRTLGHLSNDEPVSGIELAYNDYLQGEKIPIAEFRTSSQNWIPIKGIEKYPDDGQDVHLTVDVGFQYIVHNALLNQLVESNADYGCVLVMEVQTGEIKAIANLAKSKDRNEQFIDESDYFETYNHAIGTSTETGSTIKGAMLLALLEDTDLTLESIVNLEGGTKKYHDRWMRDDHPSAEDDVPLIQAFAKSSNVGFSKLIYEAYRRNPQRLISLLTKFGILEKTGINLMGEGEPYMTHPSQSEWSGISLPWSAIGYEIKTTPLQLLAFYNAVANDGIWMRPQLVKEIKQYSEVVEAYEPEAVKRICSVESARLVKEAMKEVVLSGTAKGIRSNYLSLAGKTGTVNLNPPEMKQKKYQASYVGHFPAENPHYSCIVVISNPSESTGRYYGSQIAAPVFKEIAEGIYARDTEMKRPINEGGKKVKLVNTKTKSGYLQEIESLCEYFDIIYAKKTSSPWAVPIVKNEVVELERRQVKIKESEVPNVISMGLKDALYILENAGLRVDFIGKGKVKSQSLNPGTKFDAQQLIVIELG